MANNSLTTKLLPDNEIVNLAKIFEIPLLHYHKNESIFKKDHLKKLRTIVGLGFTAILVDGALISTYERYLRTFIACDQIKSTENTIYQLAYAAAQITAGASYAFKITKYLNYHKDFVIALKKVINHLSIHKDGKNKEAIRLQAILDINTTH